MKVTWVPSKKAVTAGIVPANYKIYDIDTEVDPIPDSSLEVMLTRSFRHMYNNEAASAWKLAAEKAKVLNPPVELNRAEFLHTWRTNQRNKILEGTLGMRELAVAQTYDELTTEARLIAYTRVRKFIETKSKGTMVLGDMSAANLAREYEGKTVDAWLGDILDRAKSKNAEAIWVKAQENVDARHAEDDEDLDDIFSAESEDEDSDESEKVEPVAAK